MCKAPLFNSANKGRGKTREGGWKTTADSGLACDSVSGGGGELSDSFFSVLRPSSVFEGGVSVFLYQQPGPLWTPAGCPLIQLNSDGLYLELVSDSTGWGFCPTTLPPSPTLQTPAASPGFYLGFWLTSYKLGGSSDLPPTQDAHRMSSLLLTLLTD